MPVKLLTLSIVIPVYNEQEHLAACLDAIAAQTVKPSQVIVVNNNSADKSVSVAKGYKFVTVIHEMRQGIVFARDAGFNIAKSDIIGRIDSDTVLPDNWVEYILDFYKDGTKDNYTVSGGCYYYNLRLPHVAGWLQGQVAFRLNRLLMGHYILFGSNMALTKKQWHNVRSMVCEDNDIHEDLDLAIHMHRLGYEIAYHEDLRVGVLMRRVRSRRSELWSNMMWWPKTLKRHGKKTWVFGFIGAIVLYILSPLLPFTEWVARLFGRSPIKD